MPVHLLFMHRGAAKPAFNVLAGALDAHERAGVVRLSFARDRDELQALAREAIAQGSGPVCVAWSFYSPGLPEAVDDLAAMRAAFGGAFVAIAGGVHATAEPGETLGAGFDFVAVGEGERTIGTIVDRLARGEGLAGCEGLAWIADGFVRQGARPVPVELDEFPPFCVRHELFGAIEITRGCIYACRFCQTPYMAKARFRHRSIANVARWAAELPKAGLRDLRFVSPTSLSYGSPDEGVNLGAVEALLAACKEAMGPEGRVFFGTFPSEVRPEHVSAEALAVLRRYVHNDNLIIGGQSGSERILDASRRGHDVETIERAVRVCVENGFLPNVDFILGLPGEEPSDVDATIGLMERLSRAGAKVHGHTFMPLPGTPFKRSAPGRIDEATAARLDRLASAGRLYGAWRKQAEVAQGLAERRDRLVKLRGR